jgi:exportin-2 (importin alpha re-exporter)
MCDTVHDFLLNLVTSLLERVLMNVNSGEVQVLEILMKIFYNLNYQDLHPKFEDNLYKWMQILKTIMNLHNVDENVFKCKGAALESILLYASKYKEDVEEPIRGFCQ